MVYKTGHGKLKTGHHEQNWNNTPEYGLTVYMRKLLWYQIERRRDNIMTSKTGHTMIKETLNK